MMGKYVQFDKRGPYCNFKIHCVFFTRTAGNLMGNCMNMDLYGHGLCMVAVPAWVNFAFVL